METTITQFLASTRDSVFAGARELSPHVVSSLATRDIMSTVILGIASVLALGIAAAIYARWGQRDKPTKDNPYRQSLEDGQIAARTVAVVFCAVSLVTLIVFLTCLPYAITAWRDPLGYAILTLLGK